MPPTPSPARIRIGRSGSDSGGRIERSGGDSGEPDWDPRAGSYSGGPHGLRGGRGRNPHGRIGMGGFDPPSGASPCSRDPAVEVEAWSHLRVEEVYLDGWVSKKRWHSHAPGTRLLKLKLGRTFGWRKFASTVGSKKKGHHTYILPPCPPPYVGGLWTGWSRRPFSVAARPFRP